MTTSLDPETTLPAERLITELQSLGLRLVDPKAGASSRRGGAGPSDHKAILVDGRPIMAPVHTHSAFNSPYTALRPDADGRSVIERDGRAVGEVVFPQQPAFYHLETAEGVPYNQIAVLHGQDVLATTVLQTCIRYESRKKTCKFCAIGQSLAAGRTVAEKTPEMLAEVAEAAVRLDGVKHMVMTTGTPNKTDRGAAVLTAAARAIKARVDLPIQGQCEPPDDDIWFERMRDAGIDTLGMHVEAVSPDVRAHVMPGKAEVPIERYMEAFAAAVPVFGWGQVSTYILAGIGDTREQILEMCETLVRLGVYPFVVPFVPISGTPMEDHKSPSAAFMTDLLTPLGRMLAQAGITRETQKAGCGRCGACSALSAFEEMRP
ncbi:MAG: MSMEG_0568 family radical SAM protein [Pseudomonadota bacterium]